MTLNEAIETYAIESAKESEARKKKDAAKKFIAAAMGDGDAIQTDVWTVYAKRSTSLRLDTAALYRDFPDVKEVYGRPTTSTSYDVHARTDAEQATA